ncbi:hypothetical protein [Legionella sp. CNM-4043-24]|uniref:hypothetical protein n=1 Tax=Legionella sp. CNM-4043-24 TaxID=3421646 RepID=UPI00403B326D
MNKKALVTAAVAGSLFTAPLFAANFFQKLMHDRLPVHKSVTVHPKKEGQKYADFSGSWAGTCSFQGGTFPLALILKNDDESIVINGEPMEIGPFQTDSSSDNRGSSFEHTALEWSEDMSTLTIKDVSVLKLHSDYPYNTPSTVETYISQTVMSLNNGQLVMKAQDLDLADTQQRNASDYSCTFSKEQE